MLNKSKTLFNCYGMVGSDRWADRGRRSAASLPLFVCEALAFIFLLAAARAADLPKEILLWPNGAPGSENKTGDEKVRIADAGDHVVSNIHKPSITPFLPPT